MRLADPDKAAIEYGPQTPEEMPGYVDLDEPSDDVRGRVESMSIWQLHDHVDDLDAIRERCCRTPKGAAAYRYVLGIHRALVIESERVS